MPVNVKQTYPIEYLACTRREEKSLRFMTFDPLLEVDVVLADDVVQNECSQQRATFQEVP